MPIYEYDCGGCGSFSAPRAMSASALPAICPSCGDQAPRILSPTAGGASRGRRRSGYRDPKLVRRQRDPAPIRPSSGHADRPWMLGH